MKTSFTFTDLQTSELKAFMKGLHSLNWGTWPAASKWPSWEGCPGYVINQYEPDNGQTFEVIKFDQPVVIDGETDTRFKFGGGRKYQPVCTSLRF